MAAELKARKDMDRRYMWDLSHIFKTKEDWEAAFAELQGELASLGRFAGTLGTAKGAKEALDGFYDIVYRSMRMYVYTELSKAGDNGDPEYQAMNERATMLLVQISTAASYITPELAALPEKTLKGYLDAPELSLYRHQIADVIRGRKYVLSPEQERMLSMLADAAQTPDNSFTMLESVDMTFPTITDEKGNEVQLTHGSFGVYRESVDRRVRREAFEKYFGEFKRYINTFAAMYGGSVKFDNYFADVRGQESALRMALFGGDVPVSVYDSLIEAVHGALPAMHRYIELRKRILGLGELHMYDLYNPMVEDAGMHFTFEEAKQTVKKALAPLGEEYGRLLDRAFDESWIDVYENKGKTTGAFSCGVYGVHPYVLLNYTGELDDVFTLAHELGHAMHSYKSDQAQAYANHDYSIMAAEVASTVNEVLLLKYLINGEADKKRRAYLLNHFIESFRTTLFRQTLFAEFEKRTHEMAASGVPLTAESMNALYRQLNELYYDGAVIDELQDIEWARIPHFYNAFYVYQYSTGYSAAVAIAEGILSSGDPSEYLRFLTTGGSDYPINELRIAGVDLARPEVVCNALKEFDRCVSELGALLDELRA